MNGFLSFSINYLTYRPMPFPHKNSEEADILAPFWADSDSTGVKCDCTAGCISCGTNVVYYHIYKFDSNLTYPENSTERKVLQQTNLNGKTYIKGFKRTDWVMVVTWSQVVPYPYSANKNSIEVSVVFIDYPVLYYTCKYEACYINTYVYLILMKFCNFNFSRSKIRPLN